MAPLPADDDFPLAGETASDSGPELTGEDAGAAGASSGGIELSHGGLIAIIVVVVVVAVLGIGMSVLFYMAKKREWQIRDKMRRSARRVVAALTPRSRSEFPRDALDPKRGGSKRGRNARMRLDDVPPTPKLKPEDIEKHMASSRVSESSDADGKKKWGMGKKGGKRWPGH